MADKTRPLNKTVIETKITAELRALSAAVTGISCPSGYTTLIVHTADALSDAQIDAVIAAHDATPPTPAWLKIGAARALSVTISGTNTTTAVTFPVTLPDANYIVLPGAVNAFTGVPAALAFLAQATNLTTTGFTARLGAAPGPGNSVTVTFVGVKVA